MSKLSIFAEFIGFLKANKKAWMIPIVILLLVLGFIIIIGQGSALAPFIYTLF
ncbi:MAG: DUF5989 family protein [Acidobacteriota bacterium]